MARKKKASRSSSRRQVKKTGPKSSSKSIIVPWLPLVFHSMVVCAVVFAAKTIFDLTGAAVVTQEKFVLSSSSVSVQTPKWINQDHDLNLDFSDILKNKSLFEPNLKRLIKNRFESSYMISEVSNVDLQMPNKISASLTFRRPIVKVTQSDDSYLMDKEGVVLPLAPYLNHENLTVITSETNKQLKIGKKHPSEKVRGVLDLLEKWRRYSLSELTILEITCPSSDRNASAGQPDYVLYVYNGVKVVKLYFDKGDDHGEITLDRALSNLVDIVNSQKKVWEHVNTYIDLRAKAPFFN